MESESVQRQKQDAELQELRAHAWLEAWPRAKRAEMGGEEEALWFARAWREWTRAGKDAEAQGLLWEQARAQARALEKAQAQARAGTLEQAQELVLELVLVRAQVVQAKRAEAEALRVEAGTRARVEALALAVTWARARRERRERRERLPFGAEDSPTIWQILTSLNRNGIAHDLWHGSPETRDDYSCIINFIAPITRLPFELLHLIFLIIDDEAGSPPSALMLVCKHWHAIVTSIWGSINLGTRTPIGAVAAKLKRSQWLDIVVDTDSDRGDFASSTGPFEAIFAAIEASSRWRSLLVDSFPAEADLPEDLVNRCLQRCSNAPMRRFTAFKIKSACETSPLLDGLLHILGKTSGSELTTMEINAPNVISFLAPAYPSIFHSLKFLSLNAPRIPSPIDFLPHLHQLESFTASNISFPTYHSDVDLPFINTIRHLRLKAASIQWMSGRTFHVLEDCTLIFPLHRHALHTFSAILPKCKTLTFQGFPFEILGGVSACELTHLSVACPSSFNQRGNQQLVWLSRHVLGQSRLAPRILHIGIQATDRTWMSTLVLMENLEELVIHSAQPSALGAKVLQSFVVQPIYTSNLGSRPSSGPFFVPSCPSLRRFGLKYDRWLRLGEQFDLIPVFVSIIQSRQRPNLPLQSFGLWLRSNQTVPLELVEESQMSYKGLEHLAKMSGIGEEQFSWIPHGGRGQQEGDRGLGLEVEGLRGGAQVKVRELPEDPGTDTPMILHPSTRPFTLVGRVKRFVRRIIRGRNHHAVPVEQ